MKTLDCGYTSKEEERIDRLRPWISVEDWLPTKGEWVLIWREGLSITPVTAYWDNDWIAYDGYVFAGVTHWAELPKPPNNRTTMKQSSKDFLKRVRNVVGDKNIETHSAVELKIEDGFCVYSLKPIADDKMYSNITEDLTLVISKNGTTIELNESEIHQVIKAIGIRKYY